jgi:hypothetical protein
MPRHCRGDGSIPEERALRGGMFVFMARHVHHAGTHTKHITRGPLLVRGRSADRVAPYRIQTWALEEARRRLEAEGILPDPDTKST